MVPRPARRRPEMEWWTKVLAAGELKRVARAPAQTNSILREDCCPSEREGALQSLLMEEGRSVGKVWEEEGRSLREHRWDGQKCVDPTQKGRLLTVSADGDDFRGQG
jgi:hypothetical protein